MNILKAAAVTAVLVIMGTSSALAAEAMACCCKDKEAKMACCEKMHQDMKPAADPAVAPAEKPSTEQHKH